MHLDIDFHGNGKNHFHFHGHGNFSFDYKEAILDPSVLYYLCYKRIKQTDILYYLPDNMIRLIERSKENEENKDFLMSFLTFFRYGFGRKIKDENMNLFYSNIETMTIKPISSENIKTDQEDYYEKYLKMFSKHDFYISMSPMINFLGDYIAMILEFSKITGKIILSKSRKLANLLKENIISLELPKRIMNIPQNFDDALDVKGDFLNRMFDFRGGRSAKFFIAVCLGIGGFIHPAIGGLGVAFVFVDP